MKKSSRTRKRIKSAAPRVAAAPATSAPATSVPEAPAPDVSARETLAARVQAMAERELEAVERILQTLGPPDPDDAERAARTLASLARTLRELTRLHESGDGHEPAAGDDRIDDDTVPRNLDAFRRELSQRLDRLVAEAKAACPEPGEPD